ncbi:MAG TPA: M28 family peptidase [Longimicrobiales bacterium]|nr:M28 family peptidase [Longimicrobiales bacterium]
MRRWTLVAVGLLAAGCAQDAPEAPAGPEISLSGDSIRIHTRTLGSDEYMGRGPGHPGGDMAAQYIAGKFQEYGLEAVGGSYLQTVPMIGFTTDPSTVKLSFSGPNGTLEVPYLDGFVMNAGNPQATEAGGSAEVVFVGYGISAPETDWNDFAGVDVKGKYILILVNDPPAPAEEPALFGGPAMTYYGRWTYKWEEAARQGALGALIVHETEPAGYPWSVVRGGRSGEQFSLPRDPNAPAPAGMVGWVTQEVATKLLALAGLSYDDLKAAAAKRGFTAVRTGVTGTGSLTAAVREVETANVVGLARGSRLPDDVITVTSHYDHFGIGEPIDGDSIYNGASDNASGVGLLLEMARAYVALADRPGRSVLFIATAAEEQGLLGSQWYVQSPLFPLNQTVAEVNIDGANLYGETDDVGIPGEERNGLGVFARARAAEMGLTIVPDAEPEKGYFFRSDHFPFAKAGVPALYPGHGRQYRGKPADWGQQIAEEFTAKHYHAPSDEFSEDWVYEGAVQQGLLTLRIIWDIAQDTTWPNWNEGQEFKAARDAMMAGR